ncbi:PREDICTED: uncharacterized protein LOC109590640 [Amphimedon queenslandica]|uniref:ISXO2-like transposase domain-containing protein n=1 Tax=Amphimedon queenslandica TaxID=400682 RepID=A0A1X7SZA3_AMPQE|nr:PREDICTED: uncharacterized protein LOC109590640 [Amphimedon queenslandica]|eukprot:XP_019862099.1 PREDICTED: uncharacterized protein LOC109590640 [Amphimedon queenslandica]
MNYKTLYSTLTYDEDVTTSWLRSKHLIANYMDCKKCGSSCRLVTKKDTKVWRCPLKGCQSVISIRNESFFSGSHLKLNEIVDLIYWWSCKSTVHATMHETGHSEHTIVDWFNFLRDICADYFLSNPTVIGGPGSVIEIDKSKFGKRKYNRGRYVDGHWVFGGIERGTSNCFMVAVADRSAATLLPIIYKYVRPGSTIISDQWRAYSSLSSVSSGFTHLTVNHSLNFIDPFSGAHTQTIEGTWSQVKRMMRGIGVMNTSNDLFQTYLQEFLWRKKFSGQDPFNTIIEHIKEQYPL